MGNILRVNISDGQCNTAELPLELIGLGGRGMTSSIVAGEVPPTCDPLGPENKLVFAPGILSGTACPNSGRLSVGGKSPLTGGIKESNVGGNGASKIARVGLDALIVEGQPEPGKLFLLILKKDSAELVPADDLKGMGTYDLTKTLKEKYGGGNLQLSVSGLQVNNS